MKTYIQLIIAADWVHPLFPTRTLNPFGPSPTDLQTYRPTSHLSDLQATFRTYKPLTDLQPYNLQPAALQLTDLQTYNEAVDNLAVDNLGGALTTYLAADHLASDHLASDLGGGSFNYLPSELAICRWIKCRFLM